MTFRWDEPVAGVHAAPAMAAFAMLALLTLLAAGCADETTGVRIANQRPSIRITQGPMEDSLHIHRISFRWVGEDRDGSIEGYAYAVDDTTVADSLRATAERGVTLTFTADDFHDTVTEINGGIPVELARFGRYHTFHVRGIDDQGAWSPFASAAFFAVTVAPTTQIIAPVASVIASVGPTFEFVWDGEDLDGAGPPERFTFRLVRVPADSLAFITPERLDCEDCAAPWSPFIAGDHMRFDRMELGAYIFGVRAMDDAGAVEPELLLGRNVARIMVVQEPGSPIVSFTGPGKTIQLPSSDEEEKTFNLVSGRSTALAWSADASHYGGRVTGYSYGIDLESIDPSDPGWTLIAAPGVQVRFDNPAGVEEVAHSFHLLLSDSIDQNTAYGVQLRVGPPDLSRDILYVDDVGEDRTGGTSRPADADRDAQILEVFLAEAGRRGLRLDQYEVQDGWGRLDPDAPEWELIRLYKLLVWSVGNTSASVLEESMNPEHGSPLSDYMTLGGSLLLLGNQSLGRTKYEMTPETFGFGPREFGYQFLHIESEFDGQQVVAGEFLRPRGNPSSQRIDGMDGAHPTPMAAAEGWPELLVAKEPYTNRLFGMPIVEGMTQGYEHGNRPGRLDTLYRYITNGSRWLPFPVPSRLDDAPCAFRYAGPDQGKVMAFTFPVYWWADGAADSLGTRTIEWFFDDEEP